MPRSFTRVVENFTCAYCGAEVTGSGYTNHCPRCLYSLHVDINPGDRQAECRGLMRPVATTLKHGEFVILHECEVCGHRKPNKAAPNDRRTILIELAGRPFPYR